MFEQFYNMEVLVSYFCSCSCAFCHIVIITIHTTHTHVIWRGVPGRKDGERKREISSLGTGAVHITQIILHFGHYTLLNFSGSSHFCANNFSTCLKVWLHSHRKYRGSHHHANWNLQMNWSYIHYMWVISLPYCEKGDEDE